MKRFVILMLCALLLTGCTVAEDSMETALELRERMLEANECSFDVSVTSDYGTYLHSFALRCTADDQGVLSFEVIAPDTISGITGSIDNHGGRLTFDEEVLVFTPLADGQISPVTAPWLLIRTLRSGYIISCNAFENGTELIIDDDYSEDALTMVIRLNKEKMPLDAVIIWQNRKVLSMQIENFKIM